VLALTLPPLGLSAFVIATSAAFAAQTLSLFAIPRAARPTVVAPQDDGIRLG
jgi:hypothetical protein